MKDKSVTKKARFVDPIFIFLVVFYDILSLFFIFSKIEYWFGGIYKEKDPKLSPPKHFLIPPLSQSISIILIPPSTSSIF